MALKRDARKVSGLRRVHGVWGLLAAVLFLAAAGRVCADWKMDDDLRTAPPPAGKEREADQALEKEYKWKALPLYQEALAPVADQTRFDWAETAVNLRIREKIIRLVLSLGKNPELPDPAVQHALAGEKRMKNPGDSGYRAAVSEFQKACDLAPWWGACYYNLALAQEEAGNYEGATENLWLYLLATPGSPIAEKVRKKLYEWEILAEDQAGTKRPGHPFFSDLKVGVDLNGVYGDFAQYGWPGPPDGWEPVSTLGGDVGVYFYMNGFGSGFFLSPGFEYQGSYFSTYNAKDRPSDQLQMVSLFGRLKVGTYFGRTDAFGFLKGGYGASQMTGTLNGNLWFRESGPAWLVGCGLGYGKNVYGFLEVDETMSYGWGPDQNGVPSGDPAIYTTRFLCGIGAAIY
jgi:hypothetical protein